MGDTSKKGGQTCVLVILRVSQIKHTEADGGRREGREKTACLSTLLAAGTALLLAEPLRPPTTLAPVAGKNVNSCVAGGRGGGGGGGGGKEEAKN